MPNLEKIKKTLKFCPECACVLVDHISMSTVRVCPSHGNVFEIKQRRGSDYNCDVRVLFSE